MLARAKAPQPLSPESLAYLAQHADERPKDLAKATGISRRAVARALRSIAHAKTARPARRRTTLLAASVAIVLLGVGAAYGAWRSNTGPRSQTTAAPRSAADQASEDAVYRYLETNARGHDREALLLLESRFESTRLAAVRYLLKLGAPGESRAKALKLVDDSEARVRLATIQLAAKLEGGEVTRLLVELACNSARPIADRMLAVSSLRDHSRASVEKQARTLAAALDSAPPALRQSLHGLLSCVLPEAGVSTEANSVALSAAWSHALDKRGL